MQGVPFHKLLWKIPTAIFFTDASGISMGSYHFSSGLTWNYSFPPDILKHTTINHMEFFMFIVQLLLMEYTNTLNSQHILIWMDNQTAILWLRKQPYSDPFANWLFKILGIILLRNEFSIQGNYLSGNLNFIADMFQASRTTNVGCTICWLYQL